MKRGGRETHIKVSGWPREHAVWAVFTPELTPEQTSSPEWDPHDEAALSHRLGGEEKGGRRAGRRKGRVLQAIGFYNWDHNAAVAALLFHVETRKPFASTG